jgi:hypothetical protein
MLVLTQFIFRLSFGLSLAMAITPARQVTSGFYRNHAYVLLGFNVLASLVALMPDSGLSPAPALAAATLSYFAAAAWLYEKPRLGALLLALVSAASLGGAYLADGNLQQTAVNQPLGMALILADPPTGGLVLGVTIAAMFLGHWYLNTPTMALAPLQCLVALMAVAIVARAVVCGSGLSLELLDGGWPGNTRMLFILLRWLSGLLGSLLLAWMTWQTLKIPNTQSATGILYVGVITTFLGELTSLLLTSESSYPL